MNTFQNIEDIDIEFKERGLNAKWFIASESDTAIALNNMFKYAKDNNYRRVIIPSGTYNISSPLEISEALTIECPQPYETRINLTSDFVGDYALRVTSSEQKYVQGFTSNGFFLRMNNIPADAIIFEDIYDQFAIQNIQITDVAPGYKGMIFKISSLQKVKVLQTALLENIVCTRGEAALENDIMFDFNNVQETTLINCKAFASKGQNDIFDYLGTAFSFTDCRGINLVGCSSAFSETGIDWSAKNRGASGLTVSGHTDERVTTCLKTSSQNNNEVSKVTLLPVRLESSISNIDLASSTLSTIYAANQIVILKNSSRNIIFSDNEHYIMSSENLKETNTIFYQANSTSSIPTLSQGLRLLAAKDPQILLNAENKKSIRMRFIDPTSEDYGVRFEKYNESTSKYDTIFKISNNRVEFFDNKNKLIGALKNNVGYNETGLEINVNDNGVISTAQVIIKEIETNSGNKEKVLGIK